MHANAPFVNLYTSSNSGSTQILILVTQASPKHSFAYDISYCIRCRIWWLIFSHQLSNCQVALCNLYLSEGSVKTTTRTEPALSYVICKYLESGNYMKLSKLHLKTPFTKNTGHMCWSMIERDSIDLGHEVVRLFSSGNGAEASRGKKNALTTNCK